jgi:hypothetical protein
LRPFLQADRLKWNAWSIRDYSSSAASSLD